MLDKKEKDVVGFREYFAIVFFSIATKATDMSVVPLFRDGLNAAWLIIIGSFLMVIPSILFLNHVLKRYQSLHILEITERTLGKLFALIYSFIIFCFAFSNVSSDTRSYMDQLITVNYPKTPLFVIYFIFLIICIWIAKKGWETIASIAWLVFPLITISLGLLVILALKDSIFLRTFPIFGLGEWKIAKASFRFTPIFMDVFIFAILYPMVKDHKTYTQSLYASLLFTLTVMTTLYLTYIWIFDYRSIDKILYPFNDLIRFISIGRSITNLETFFITLWLITVFVKFTVYIYVVSKLFGFIFHIKEFENTILPIGLLVLMVGMIPENEVFNIFEIRRFTATYSRYFHLLLPPLLWIVIKFKGVKAI